MNVPFVGVLKRGPDCGAHLGNVESPDFDSVVHGGGKEKITGQRDVTMKHFGTVTLHATENAHYDMSGNIPKAHREICHTKEKRA